MPAMPPRRARVPLTLLVAATRTRRFWMTIARHAIPVVGVLAFNWSAMNIAVFFLLESWLFLSTRLAIEVTFDPHFGGGSSPQSSWRGVMTTLWMFALSAIVCGVLVFGFGGFIIAFAFQAEEWHRFVTERWARPSFLLSLLALTSDVFLDGIDFKRRLLERSPAEKRMDDLQTRVMFYRVGILMMACMIIGLAGSVGLGGPVLVIVIMISLVYVDLFPHRAVKIFD
jgi:hypothetical protein